MQARRALPLLAALCLGAGCVGADEDARWLAPSEDGKADGDWDGLRLFARYALRIETRVRAVDTVKEAACARDPRADDCKTVESNEGVVLSGVVEAVQDGGRATLKDRLCDFRLTKYGDVTLDPKVFGNLQPATFVASLPAAQAPRRVSTAPGAFLFGVNLSDPMREPLPSDKRDARVIDQDQDGRAGVSVRLPLGRRIDFGARFVTALAGDVDDQGRIAGVTRSATVNYDFVVYDDNIPFVDAAQRAMDTLAKQRIVEQTIDARLVPLRSDAPTCADALGALR